MSQSATFYPIDKKEFSSIKLNPGNLDVLKDKENYVTFLGTHEGLRFLFSKLMSNQQTNLVNEIFYPTTQLLASQSVLPSAEEEQEFVDVTDNENYEDFDREPVSYHHPEKVKQIAALLNSINDEKILKGFDPEELNKNYIYPCC